MSVQIALLEGGNFWHVQQGQSETEWFDEGIRFVGDWADIMPYAIPHVHPYGEGEVAATQSPDGYNWTPFSWIYERIFSWTSIWIPIYNKAGMIIGQVERKNIVAI